MPKNTDSPIQAVTTKVTLEQFEQIRNIAIYEDRTVSYVVRALLRFGLKSYFSELAKETRAAEGREPVMVKISRGPQRIFEKNHGQTTAKKTNSLL